MIVRLRLFVAAYPSPAACEALAAACPELPPPWRPVPPDRWHLTLAFLGEVPGDRLPDLTERLGRAATRSRLTGWAIAGGGAFPSPDRASVLWAGVTGDRDGLIRLAGRAAAAARRTGVPIAQQRYRPHVTLARARTPGGADARSLVAALQSLAAGTEPVTEVVLVRSVLGAQARHERLAGWRLPR